MRKFAGRHRWSVAAAAAFLALLVGELLTRETVAMRTALYGRDHADVAESLHTLAFQLLLQGRLAEAEPLFLETLAMRRRIYGDGHPEVADARSRLGLFLFQQGRADEAEPLYREALAVRRRVLPWLEGCRTPALSHFRSLLRTAVPTNPPLSDLVAVPVPECTSEEVAAAVNRSFDGYLGVGAGERSLVPAALPR